MKASDVATIPKQKANILRAIFNMPADSFSSMFASNSSILDTVSILIIDIESSNSLVTSSFVKVDSSSSVLPRLYLRARCGSAACRLCGTSYFCCLLPVLQQWVLSAVLLLLAVIQDVTDRCTAIAADQWCTACRLFGRIDDWAWLVSYSTLAAMLHRLRAELLVANYVVDATGCNRR